MVYVITFKEMATVGKVRHMLVDSCLDKLKINHEEGCSVFTSVICTALKRIQGLSIAPATLTYLIDDIHTSLDFFYTIL